MNHEVDVDGVTFSLPLDELEIGASFFVPALRLHLLKRRVKKMGKNLGMVLEPKSGSENGYYGVRFYRRK